jgi:hypothetical protein
VAEGFIDIFPSHPVRKTLEYQRHRKTRTANRQFSTQKAPDLRLSIDSFCNPWDTNRTFRFLPIHSIRSQSIRPTAYTLAAQIRSRR